MVDDVDLDRLRRPAPPLHVSPHVVDAAREPRRVLGQVAAPVVVELKARVVPAPGSRRRRTRRGSSRRSRRRRASTSPGRASSSTCGRARRSTTRRRRDRKLKPACRHSLYRDPVRTSTGRGCGAGRELGTGRYGYLLTWASTSAEPSLRLAPTPNRRSHAGPSGPRPLASEILRWPPLAERSPRSLAAARYLSSACMQVGPLQTAQVGPRGGRGAGPLRRRLTMRRIALSTTPVPIGRPRARKSA